MNMESRLTKEFMIDGQTVHVPMKITRHELTSICTMMLNMLIVTDARTGAPIRDMILELPTCVFVFLNLVTDMNVPQYMEKPGHDMYTLYDEFYNAHSDYDMEYSSVVSEIIFQYEKLAENKMQQIRDMNSVGAQLKMFICDMIGSADGKDMGMIRSMLTDMVIKANKADALDRGDVAGNKNVLDFSAFKAKNV